MQKRHPSHDNDDDNDDGDEGDATKLDGRSNHESTSVPRNHHRQHSSSSSTPHRHHHHRVNNPFSSSSSSSKRKKFRFRSLAKWIIFGTWMVWIGTFVVFFRNFPMTSWWNSNPNSNSNAPESGGIPGEPSDLLRSLRTTTLMKLHTPPSPPKDPQTAVRRSSSPYTIVHSVTTRFMLGQKGQPVLARARYLLFETFCYPTVKHQSALALARANQSGSESNTAGDSDKDSDSDTARGFGKLYDFSWFVLVDPGIDRGVIEDLQKLLASSSSSSSSDSSSSSTSSSSASPNFPDGNAYLILTDNPAWAADGVGVPNVTSYGAGFQEIARAVRDGTVEVLTGNPTRLLQTLEDSFGERRERQEQKQQHQKQQHGSHPGDGTRNNENNESDDKPLMLIETMLDADDGLNNRAIEWVQDLAISHTQLQQEWLRHKTTNAAAAANNNNNNNKDTMDKSPPPATTTATTTTIRPSLNTTWWLLCGTDHIEWHNREVFRLTDQQYKASGVSSGIVGLRREPHYCASAGFTRVGLTTKPKPKAKALPMSLPLPPRLRNRFNNSDNSNSGNSDNDDHQNETKTSQHQTVSFSQPLLAFPEVAYSNHALATEQFDLCYDGWKAEHHPNITLAHCFRRDFPYKPYALKSRSITSDSMDHMDPRRKDYRDLPWENATDHPLLGLDKQDWMWQLAEEDFSIDPILAQRTSAYLREHLATILVENNRSRCAPGFPCRQVATLTLKRMAVQVKRLNRANQRQQQQQQQQQPQNANHYYKPKTNGGGGGGGAAALANNEKLFHQQQKQQIQKQQQQQQRNNPKKAKPQTVGKNKDNDMNKNINNKKHLLEQKLYDLKRRQAAK